MVVAFVLLSELTKAWLLYLGLVFLFMVMYAPGGIASLIMMNVRVAALRQAAPAAGRGTLALAGDRARDAGRRGGADRDGLPPAARRGARSEAALPGRLTLDTTVGGQLARRAGGHRWSASRCSSSCGAASRASLGHGSRARSRTTRSAAQGGRGVSEPRPTPRRAEGSAQVLRQDRDHPRRRTWRSRRASGSRSSARTAPASRPCSTSSAAASARPAARSLLNGKRIDGLLPYEINRARAGAQLPDHQHLRPALGVREPALRRALGAGLHATRSGSSWPTCATPTSAPRS